MELNKRLHHMFGDHTYMRCLCLLCIYRPILLNLKFFGVLHKVEQNDKTIRKDVLWRYHAYCVIWLLWFGFLRHTVYFFLSVENEYRKLDDVSSYWKEQANFLMFIYSGWHFFACVSLLTINCRKLTERILHIFKAIDELGMSNIDLELLFLWHNTLSISLLMLLCIMSVGSAYSYVYAKYNILISSPVMNPILKLDVIQLIPSFFFTLESLYSGGFFMFIYLMFSSITFIVYRQSQRISDMLEETAKRGRLPNKNYLVLLKKRCELLQEIVTVTDQIFSPIHSLAVVISLVALTTVMYQLLFTTNDSPATMFLLIIGTIIASVVSLLWMSTLYTYYHRPFNHLCRAVCIQLTLDEQDKMIYLMKRLGLSATGMTWFQMFVVTKSSILKVFSFVMSIFLFLLQCQQLSRSNTSHCKQDNRSNFQNYIDENNSISTLGLLIEEYVTSQP